MTIYAANSPAPIDIRISDRNHVIQAKHIFAKNKTKPGKNKNPSAKCVIPTWKCWLTTPKEQDEWGPFSPCTVHLVPCFTETQNDTKNSSLVWHHDARAVPKKHSLLYYFWFLKKKERFYWNDCGKWHKRNVLTVSNDSWFFLKLDVIDCNYKPSMYDQLEDV